MVHMAMLKSYAGFCTQESLWQCSGGTYRILEMESKYTKLAAYPLYYLFSLLLSSSIQVLAKRHLFLLSLTLKEGINLEGKQGWTHWKSPRTNLKGSLQQWGHIMEAGSGHPKEGEMPMSLTSANTWAPYCLQPHTAKDCTTYNNTSSGNRVC